MKPAPSFWLMKTEPDVFSLDDLKNSPGGTTLWDGVRNYQARNFMRDEMHRGDGVLFYHSRCEEPAVVGLARIASEKAEADPSQFDPESKYFDPKSSRANPRWVSPRVQFIAYFQHPVTLRAMKADPVFSEMRVTQRGQRLSVQPVEKDHFLAVCKAGGLRGPLKLLG